MLGALLQQAGYQNIRQKPHAIDFSAGTDSYMDLYRNYEVFFHLLKPMSTPAGFCARIILTAHLSYLPRLKTI